MVAVEETEESLRSRSKRCRRSTLLMPLLLLVVIDPNCPLLLLLGGWMDCSCCCCGGALLDDDDETGGSGRFMDPVRMTVPLLRFIAVVPSLPTILVRPLIIPGTMDVDDDVIAVVDRGKCGSVLCC